MANFKKILVGSSMVVLLTGLCTSFVYADSSKTGVVTGESVNVRQSTDTSSGVLIQLSKNTKVTIIDSSNGWYKVSYAGVTGWISGQYVTANEAVSTALITGDDVNIRVSPSTEAKVLTQLSENTKVEVLDESNGWCKVKYGSSTGWVSRKYLSINSGPTAVTTADAVNLRKAAGTSAEVLDQLHEGEKVNILERSGEWYKVKTLDGLTGWVFKDFLSVSGELSSRGISNVVENAKSADEATAGSNVISIAKKQLGVKYVYGGSSPKGFDCSGFVYYVYGKAGVKLNRVAADQATEGTKIKKADLKAGDLVFFDTNGGHNYINHVGIYIGGGKFIHASSGSTSHKVTTSDLTDGFYADTYMTARRVLK